MLCVLVRIASENGLSGRRGREQKINTVKPNLLFLLLHVTFTCSSLPEDVPSECISPIFPYLLMWSKSVDDFRAVCS